MFSASEISGRLVGEMKKWGCSLSLRLLRAQGVELCQRICSFERLFSYFWNRCCSSKCRSLNSRQAYRREHSGVAPRFGRIFGFEF